MTREDREAGYIELSRHFPDGVETNRNQMVACLWLIHITSPQQTFDPELKRCLRHYFFWKLTIE